ncbi:hypothetical protein [Pelomonas cellulosilytica]|uniref:Uncharacterized protein n=1 Tax=Pelomonas cellulosilytica TaxID=2906762 RepID=A0ABS8XM01_9BURK|nr:hypothetical protein [Pelomonas sp. P8]MCE4553804.1 hypothetical protein [Pelomonas sp. P8]
MDYIISVLLGIVGNLLTPTAKRVLRWPAEIPDDPTLLAPLSEQSELDDAYKEQIRVHNRARLNRAARILWIHAFTFFALFAAFYMPLMWKATPGHDVELAATRLSLLSGWSFRGDRLLELSLLLASAFYAPLWLISQPIGNLIATAWDQLYKVSPARYASLIGLAFMAQSFLIAGNWIYLLYPNQSYVDALMLPVVLVLIGGYFGSARR